MIHPVVLIMFLLLTGVIPSRLWSTRSQEKRNDGCYIICRVPAHSG